jgi:DNA-binding GntR family transcriptional regulator
VELSVPRLEAEDIDQARALLQQLERAEMEQNAAAFVEANYQFHLTLRSRCPWPKLAHWVDTLWNGFPPLTPQFVANQMARDRDEHRALLEAAEQGDGVRAAALMRQHIQRSWDAARTHFRALGWPENHSRPLSNTKDKKTDATP